MRNSDFQSEKLEEEIDVAKLIQPAVLRREETGYD